MPAKDRYHDTVVRALRKDGWTILGEQVDLMETLYDTLKAVLTGYTGRGLNGESLLTRSEDGRLLTVVSIAQVRGDTVVDSGLIVRLIGEHIVIDRDNNSKPLVEALLQAGVPRERIVLAYAGESVPDAA
jgi:hypothetical protein